MIKKSVGGEQVKKNDRERDPIYTAIGSRIKQIRKSKGITQAVLAQDVGIATSHMSHIESAQSNASLKTIIKIADALSVGVDDRGESDFGSRFSDKGIYSHCHKRECQKHCREL